jgi:hypothetical protein
MHPDWDRDPEGRIGSGYVFKKLDRNITMKVTINDNPNQIGNLIYIVVWVT